VTQGKNAGSKTTTSRSTARKGTSSQLAQILSITIAAGAYHLVIPTREPSETGDPGLSEVEGNLLFYRGLQDSKPSSLREGYDAVVPTEIRIRRALAPEVCVGWTHPRLAGGTIPLWRKYTAICP
jgi:hypothetical protein